MAFKCPNNTTVQRWISSISDKRQLAVKFRSTNEAVQSQVPSTWSRSDSDAPHLHLVELCRVRIYGWARQCCTFCSRRTRKNGATFLFVLCRWNNPDQQATLSKWPKRIALPIQPILPAGQHIGHICPNAKWLCIFWKLVKWHGATAHTEGKFLKNDIKWLCVQMHSDAFSAYWWYGKIERTGLRTVLLHQARDPWQMLHHYLCTLQPLQMEAEHMVGCLDMPGLASPEPQCGSMDHHGSKLSDAFRAFWFARDVWSYGTLQVLKPVWKLPFRRNGAQIRTDTRSKRLYKLQASHKSDETLEDFAMHSFEMLCQWNTMKYRDPGTGADVSGLKAMAKSIRKQNLHQRDPKSWYVENMSASGCIFGIFWIDAGVPRNCAVLLSVHSGLPCATFFLCLAEL